MPSVRVGILHSLSGTMAISEAPLRDAALMAIAEINARGGVLGHALDPLVEDTESEPTRFAHKARLLLERDGAAVLFGGWTSASRKAMLPVLEAAEALLWYPLQYEGLEQSPHVFYTGACPNQQVEPALNWLRARGHDRLYLVGSDYVFPRTVHKIVRAYAAARNLTIVGEDYLPLGERDFGAIVERLQQSSAQAAINTLNGDSNLAFYRQFRAAGLRADRLPILAFSLSEVELQRMPGVAAGHYASWTYFQQLDRPQNRDFVARFRERFGRDRVTSDPVEAAYTQVHLWQQAVERAGSFAPKQVRAAAIGLAWEAPSGPVRVHANQHLWKHCRIGCIRPDDQFDIAFSTDGPLEPLPWLGLERTAGQPAGDSPADAPQDRVAMVRLLLSDLSRAWQFTWESQETSRRLQRTLSQLHREIQERRRAELETQLLLQTIQAIVAAPDFEAALQVTLREVGSTIDWDYGEAWVPDRADSHLRFGQRWYARDASLKTLSQERAAVRIGPREGLVGRVWRSRQIEWETDATASGDRAIDACPAWGATGLRAACAIPIAQGDRVLAVLAFFKTARIACNPRQVELLRAVATQLGAQIQRKQTEAALQENQRMLSTLMDNLPGMVYRCRADGTRTLSFASVGCLNLTGYSQTELLSDATRFANLIHPDDRARVRATVDAALERRQPFAVAYRAIAANGELRWFWEQGRGIPDETGRYGLVEGFIADITGQKLAETALQQELDRALLLREIVDDIRSTLDPGEMFRTAARRIGSALRADRCTLRTYVPDAAPPCLPVAAEYRLPERAAAATDLWVPDCPWAERALASDRALAICDARLQGAEALGVVATGALDWISLLAVRTSYQNEPNGLVVLEACTDARHWTAAEIDSIESVAAQLGIAIAQAQLLTQEQQQRRALLDRNRALERAEAALTDANRELERLANFDGLTGVANRRRFDDYLNREWPRLGQARLPLCVMLCDVDFFKPYNDTYGHQAGDACLQQLARAMQEAVRHTCDLVARYGGEEFALVLPGTDEAGAVQVADRLRQAVADLALPHASSSIADRVTVSIGIAWQVPDPARSPADLVAAADAALYAVKQSGRDSYRVRRCD